MLLRKTLSLSDATLKLDGDSGRFAGYASVFGGVDSYGDTIVRGAFESTLRNNGKPKMFFNHEWSMPIGKWIVAREDEKGLWVEGELTPGLNLSSEVRAAMKHETLDGLSIGGFLKKGDFEETEGGRVIRKWSNLVEISPVVFPVSKQAASRAASTSWTPSKKPRTSENLSNCCGMQPGSARGPPSRWWPASRLWRRWEIQPRPMPWQSRSWQPAPRGWQPICALPQTPEGNSSEKLLPHQAGRHRRHLPAVRRRRHGARRRSQHRPGARHRRRH
jgi:HK97 family phage prohead protease